MSKLKIRMRYTIWLFFCSQVLLFAQENPEDIALAEDKTENNFYESVKQRAIENYDKAIVAIEKCIQIDNTNPVFYHELGKNYLDLKQYPQAEKAFQKAVDLNPKERWYWNGLYDVYYPAANRELAEMKELAQKDGIDEIQSWDLAYYTEKLKKIENKTI